MNTKSNTELAYNDLARISLNEIVCKDRLPYQLNSDSTVFSKESYVSMEFIRSESAEIIGLFVKSMLNDLDNSINKFKSRH